MSVSFSVVKDGDFDANHVYAVTDFTLPDGIIVPSDISTDGHSVIGDGVPYFELYSDPSVMLSEAHASGNTISVSMEAADAESLMDSSLVMHSNAFKLQAEKETVYVPADMDKIDIDSLNISIPEELLLTNEEAKAYYPENGKYYTKDELDALPPGLLVHETEKTTFFLDAGSHIDINANLSLESADANKDQSELTFQMSNSLDIESGFLTDAQTELLDPVDPTKVYQENPFMEKYSTGAIDLGSTTAISHGSAFVNGYTSSQDELYWVGNNFARNNNAWVYYENAATYNNKRYDVKIYTWAKFNDLNGQLKQSVFRYLVKPGAGRGYGFACKWGTLYKDANKTQELYPYIAQKPDITIALEIHVLEHTAAHNGAEINFDGIINFKDLDNDEGIRVDPTGGYWTTQDSLLVKGNKNWVDFGSNTNQWIYGSIQNEESPDAILYAALSTGPSKNTMVYYHAPGGRETNINTSQRSISFYLTSNSAEPAALHTTKGNKITNPDAVAAALTPWNSTYNTYGSYTLPALPNITGYTATGYSNVDNFTSIPTGYRPGDIMTINESKKIYIKYTKQVGKVEVTKTVNPTTKSKQGWEFTLSGTSTIGEAVNIKKTTDANGKAIFTDIPIGTYTISETVNSNVWTSSVSPTSVTVTNGGTAYVSATNTYKMGSITVTKAVTDVTGLHPGLNGFIFKLTGTANDGTSLNTTATTGTNGKAVFSNVPAGS